MDIPEKIATTSLIIAIIGYIAMAMHGKKTPSEMVMIIELTALVGGLLTCGVSMVIAIWN